MQKYRPTLRTNVCEVCRRPFKSIRKDAKVCSNACAQRKSRAGRKKKKEAVTQVTIHQLELLLMKHRGK